MSVIGSDNCRITGVTIREIYKKIYRGILNEETGNYQGNEKQMGTPGTIESCSS
jgi:hypothetical protein